MRASPNLTRRIRSVLKKVGGIPPEQLEAALSDPNTITEFALVTGNDPSLITSQNGPALLAVIKNAATKEAEIRYRAEQAAREDQHRAEIVRRDEIIRSQQSERAEVDTFLRKQADELETSKRESERKDDLFIFAMASNIHREISIYWFAATLLALIAGVGFLIDYALDITSLDSVFQIASSIVLGTVAFYMTIATFLPRFAPDNIRRRVARLVAHRQLKNSIRPELNPKVLAYIDRDLSLKRPQFSLTPDEDLAAPGHLGDSSTM